MSELIEITNKSTINELIEWRKLQSIYLKEFKKASATMAQIKELESRIFSKFDEPNVRYRDLAITEVITVLPLDIEEVSKKIKIDLSTYQAKTINKKIVIIDDKKE